MSTAALTLAMELMVKTADTKLKAANKLMKICGVREKYLKNLSELEKLQKADSKPGASAPTARGGKKGRKRRKKEAKLSAAGGEDGADSSNKSADEKELLEVTEQFAAAVADLNQLDERLERERAQCRQAAWQLGAEKNARRERTVTQAEVSKWSSVRLKCSSKVIRSEPGLEIFLASLEEAPCLEALELSLGNRARTRKALRQVLGALPTAPSRIQELVLTFGVASREDMIALLGHVKGHLQKLSVAAPYQHAVYETPDALQRFWAAVEETGLTTLDVPGDCLKLKDAVGFPLQAAKWRLETLSAAFTVGEERTLLPELIRANAATLRKAKVVAISSIHADDRKAVVAALAECGKLVDVTVPCWKEAAQLERCTAVTKLSILAANLILAGRADREIEAVAKLLAVPAVRNRVESLSLSFFKYGGITNQAVQLVYKAVRGMRKLTSLSVEFCAGFAGELKATLKSLPQLEELQLSDDDTAWKPKVLDDITPAHAPSLTSLRLDPDLLSSAARLQEAARAIQLRFAAAGRRLEVHVEKGVSHERDPTSSDEEDDDGDSDDQSPDEASDDDDSSCLTMGEGGSSDEEDDDEVGEESPDDDD